MLGLFEKTTWILTVILLLALGAWVGIYGLPSTTPRIAMQSKALTKAEFEKKASKEQQDAVAAMIVGTEIGSDGKPQKKSGGRRPSKRHHYAVDKNLHQRLGNLNDCMSELDLAKSEVQADGSLKVFDIQEGSLLEKVGLKDNDVLTRVLGNPINFESAGECHDAWQESWKKLETGQSIVVEIKRNGQLQHIVVTPDFSGVNF